MTDYQIKFLDQMRYGAHVQEHRTLYSPTSQNGKGYFISYEGRNIFQFVVANYMIQHDFELDFDSSESYLRLGIIEKGVSKYNFKSKRMTEFSPSPFIVMENSISGKQSWESGHHYKGTELIINMSVLKNELLVNFPELKALFKLKENFIYYYLPDEVMRIFDSLKIQTLSNSLTPLNLEASILKCLVIIVEEINAKSGNNYINHYNYSIIGINKERTARLTQNDVEAINKAHRLIIENIDAPPSIASLSRHMYISEQKLTIGFKKLFGLTIGQYIIDQKLIRAAKYLTTTDLSVHSVALKSGYVNTSNFSKTFRRKYQKSPLQYRKSHH
ncbi:MAG: AraC family transcriptional regulator [Clostridiales bacterium]|nr:AraC family transcriptional regulator [Clostridiales bacterium]